MWEMKFRCLNVVLLFFLSTGLAYGQPASEHAGVKLYREGKHAEARRVLEWAVKDKVFGKDPEMWNYLGLAFVGEGDKKSARKAFERAVKLQPGMAVYHVNLAYVFLSLGERKKARGAADKALAIDPRRTSALIIRGWANYSDSNFNSAERDADQAIAIDADDWEAYQLKSNALIGRFGEKLIRPGSKVDRPLLEQSADVLREALDKCGTRNCAELKAEYEDTLALVDFFKKQQGDVSVPSASTPPSEPEPNTTPIKILSKPRPSYTDRARQSNTQGTIIVMVLFRENGTIGHVLPITRLGNGLDEQAIRAAQKIKFEPPTRNGKPYPVVRQIEYSFSIY